MNMKITARIVYVIFLLEFFGGNSFVISGKLLKPDCHKRLFKSVSGLLGKKKVGNELLDNDSCHGVYSI